MFRNSQFDTFLHEKLKNPIIQYGCYKGIIKKDYPKWAGWKIINAFKARGIDIKDIKDDKLDILVENFYYLEFIQESFK